MAAPIYGVRWWGTEIKELNESCMRSDLTFTLSFFSDAMGKPGSLIALTTVVANREETELNLVYGLSL